MTDGTTEKAWRVLGWLVLLLVVLAYPIRYFQQTALGRVVLYTGVIRLTLLLAVFALAAWTATRQQTREQLGVLAIGYVLVSVFLYNVINVDFGIFYTAYGFDLFCVPPAIALLFFMNGASFPPREAESERRVVVLLLAIAVPVALFGIVQYLLDDPVLRTNFASVQPNEYGMAGQAGIRLTALVATGHLRANSIFGSALDFGQFDVLFGILSMSMAVKTRGRPLGAIGYIVLAGIFLAAAASTSTRNILIYFGCCAIGFAFVLAGFGSRALVAVSLSLGAIFYGTIFGLVQFAPRFFLGFFDVVSLYQRARGVYATVDRYIVNADSGLHAIFGFGYMQSLDFKFLPTTVFDNTALDIYLYAGICGVIVYLALLLILFRHALRMWRETRSPAWLAAASLLVGTPLFSTLNIDLDQPFLLFVFGLLVSGWTPAASRASAPAGNAATGREMGWSPA